MNLQTRQQKFHTLYQKAKKIGQGGYYDEARKEYKFMLDNFSINEVDYTDYICVMADLGDAYKLLKNFKQSKEIYLKAIALLNEAKRYSQKASQYEIQKQKYHLYSNLGLLLCEEAEIIQDKHINYEKFKNIVDESLSYYRTCQKIVVDMIIEENKIQGESQNIFWWKNQYIGLIINMLNPLQTQAFQFEDKSAMSLMVKLIQRAERFYSLSSKKIKQHLQTNLSKCYYFKALCYRFLGKKTESEKYFQKDFNYCLKNHQKEDLQKTRAQIQAFYISNFQFSQAKKYTKSESYLQKIKKAEQQYLDLMRRLQAMEKDFFNGISVDLNDLQNLLYESRNKICNKKAIQFVKNARMASQFKQNQKFRYWIQYYSSEIYYQLQSYNESLKYIKEALQLANNEPEQIVWCLLQQALTMDKVENDRNKVGTLFTRCIQKSTMCSEECRQQCAKQFEEFKLREKRRNRDFKLDEKCSQRLFDHIEKKKMKRQQRKMEEVEQIDKMSNQVSEDEEFYQPQKKLIKTSNPLSRYIETCRIYNIEPLQKFKQMLTDTKQVDLQSLIYFPTEQILALIIAAPYIHNFDLRNVILTPEMLKNIHESQNLTNIKDLRLNMINSSISNKKDQVFDELTQLLRKIPFLENFTISNLYKIRQIKVIVEANSSGSFQNLKILKLKECQIQDKDLVILNLGERLPQLKKLSLSRNNLEGQTLEALISLKELEQLSLSQNPLSNISLSAGFQSLKKISLNGLSNKISGQKKSTFIPLLLNCSIIKMKESSEGCAQILKVLVEYVIEYETELSNLKELVLCGSQFKAEELINLLWRFERNAPNLKSIDARNCKLIDIGENQKIIEEIGNFGKMFMKGRFNQNRMEEENPEQIRNFKFQNFKFLHQKDPKLTRNFNVN